MEVFDAAPMNQSCAVRPQTTVAPQTLALFNGEFAREAGAAFARRLQREAGNDMGEQVERAFQIAFARAPTADERNAVHHFLAEQAIRRSQPPQSTPTALIDFCHVLLNANELIYLD